MKIIKQSAELLWHTPQPLQVIERAGRVSYKSEDKITDTSAVNFVAMLIDRGHESVIEHASASIRMVTDRGVSHEIVRHRLFSFTQESTRYCNYALGKFVGGISIVHPSGLTTNQIIRRENLFNAIQQMYEMEIAEGVSPQIARGILPTCLKTEIVVTGNFRQWRHFLKLRTAKVAHPQMREIAMMTLVILHDVCPQVFPMEAGQ